MIKWLAGLTVALMVFASTASAQRPNTREGFWIGVGIGGGSAGIDCADCSDDRQSSGTGYLRLGGTVSPHVLLGFDGNGWSYSDAGVDEVLSFGMFMVSWYPSATGAFFLKFGLGGMSYVADDGFDELTATAGAGSLGIGYDIRVARNFSITPYINTMGSAPADFKVNGATVPINADFSLNLISIGLGFHWH